MNDERLGAERDAIREAQQWAQEARTHRATVLDILRYFGLPEHDWRALRLIREKLEGAASGVMVDAPASKADERMRHDYPLLQQFHTRHALGAMAAPSCLCCGQQTHPITRPIAVKHMELPAIVVCKPCKDASGVQGTHNDQGDKE